MRIAVTIAKDSKGKWTTLALPDTPIDVQKKALKTIIRAGGKDGKAQLTQAMILSSTGQVKRTKFRVEPVVAKSMKKPSDEDKKSAENTKGE